MDWQNIIIQIAAALLAAIGAWVLAKVKTLINTKVKNEKARELLTAATETVSSVVKATYQSYVEAIKGTDAWTSEAQQKALTMAAHNAKIQMSAEVQNYIAANFGDVETWLKSQIEAKLYDLKNTPQGVQNESN